VGLAAAAAAHRQLSPSRYLALSSRGNELHRRRRLPV
jgi:hypothetical protein